jgi:transcriptional regulator with XRE-family HTH domain
MPYRTKLSDAAIALFLVDAGGHVRRHRIAAGLSQSHLAALSGVSQPTISRIERGVAPGLRMERLAAIMVILDIPNLANLRWRRCA